ncbi:MAG: hypothetical protein PUB93_02125 [Firmicutes bacterium]|nr:hypothetical protein [Bacillota bacterium]
MKQNTYLLNTLLAAIVGLVLLACVLIGTFLPGVILPELNIPAMTLLSLAALLLDYYLAPGAKRLYPWIFLFSAVTFGLLPLAAGMTAAAECWKPALAGGVVFTVVTWLFTSMVSRITSGTQAKAAPVLSALGIYLAVQGLVGIFL